MRIWASILLLGILAGGCLHLPFFGRKGVPAAGKGGSAGWTPTGNDDVDVVVVALFDFISVPQSTPLADGKRDAVVVNKMTIGPGNMLSNDQLSLELRRTEVPAGTITSLQTRNQSQSEVNWIPQGLPFYVSDLDILPQDAADFQTKFAETYPKAYAGIWLWLPGFSEDGDWAIVRLSFGPTPHGATATYLLTKDETGKWRVVNRKFNYFA